MQTLISMEMTPSEAKEESGIAPEETPKYPWGLCIELNEDSLAKLGLDKLPAVGSGMALVAKAEVQSVSESQYQGDAQASRRLSLQITDLNVQPEAADTAGVLYDAKG